MRASHIRMLVYDFKCLGTNEYDSNEPNYEPATIIIDNEVQYPWLLATKMLQETTMLLGDTTMSDKAQHETNTNLNG